jgi:hypothetical protein
LFLKNSIENLIKKFTKILKISLLVRILRRRIQRSSPVHFLIQKGERQMKATMLTSVWLFAAVGILLSPPAFAEDSIHMLGGVNLEKYCQGKHGVLVKKMHNAYGWRCIVNGQEVPVSIEQACRDQYKDPTAEDRLGDFYNPYSWGCFTDAKLLGSVKFDGYCKSLGHQGEVIDGTTAYDVHCLTKTGKRVNVSPTDACRWTWRNHSAIDRLTDFHNPRSYECWGAD